MSNVVEDIAEGWCVKVAKSTAKKKYVTPHHECNNNINQQHHSQDIIKKIENYINKAKKFTDPEQLLCDLKQVKEITVQLHKSCNILEWTTK
jgi:hypothetical protein